MKKIIIILTIFAVITACGKLENLNVNTKDPSAVPGETLFTTAQWRLFNFMASTNVNRNNFRLFAQYWTETTYTDESNYDLTTRTTPDNLWDWFYINTLKNLNESSKVLTSTPSPAGEDPAVKKNKLAIIDIMEVYCYEILVETFGNVPYSQALDIEIPLPKYDDGMTIYKDLLTRIDTDLANLDKTNESFGIADNMYHGNVGLWIKFANSLKLRMGMVLADVDNTTAKKAVEEAAGKTISSNNDNAQVKFLTAAPNTNPLYIDLIASGRHDFVPANTVVDSMNSLNDPRMEMYFTLTSFNFRKDDHNTNMDSVVTFGSGKIFYFSAADGADDSIVFKQPPYTILASDSSKNIRCYDGGVYGASNDFQAYSHIADIIQDPTFPASIFDYAEVEFLLAEAVGRGYNVGGTAEDHYNKAITASIVDWGVKAGLTAADATTLAVKYLANPRVAYTTAQGPWKEKIGIQSWIAYYNRGFEAWTQWRRLDYPLLQPGADALTAIPLRYTYPIEEQTLNGDNWRSASTAVGGDAVDTHLFWDKN